MTLETPVWQAFDPATDDVPASILALLDGDRPVRVLALAVAPTAEDESWTAAVSVRIAETAASRGARTLLVDLGLEGSLLPAELGLTPGEGICDVFEFGASARRVSVGVREGAFLFVPAGTVVGDAAKIFEHPRWEAVLAGYRKSGTFVLLHLPLSLEGAGSLLERADAVVFLAGPSAPTETLVSASTEVHAVLGPPAAAEDAQPGLAEPDAQEVDVAEAQAKLESAGDVASLEVHLSESLDSADDLLIHESWEEPAPDPSEPAPDVGAAGEALPAQADPDLEPDPFWDEALGETVGTAGDGEDTEAASTSEGPEPTPSGDDLEGLPVGDSAPGGGSRRRVLLLLALFILLVVVAMLVRRGGGDSALSGDPAGESGEAPIEVSAARSADPGMSDAEGEARADETEVTPVAEGVIAGAETVDRSEADRSPTAPGDSPPGSTAPSPNALMRFGLTINAHERQAAAEDQARELRARFPSVQFILVPVQVRGTTYYRVVAGPAATGDEAEGIRGQLAGYIGTAVARGAIVRSTRVAFLLGEYESLDEAMTRRGQAEEAGIPAYLAEYGPSEGPLRYRVYAGAYATAREADHLQTLLIESGLTGAILTERMGRPLR